MISREDVKKLALLARMELSTQEEDTFASEIDSILSYVGQISSLPTEDAEELSPIRNVFRPDETPHESGLFTDAVLEQAPSREGNYIKVKKILNND